MTRPLLLTAAFGFVVAIVCFASAAALGPIGWENWSFHDGGHGFHRHGWRHWHGWGPEVSGEGPQTSRDLVWSGTDSLTVDAPAEVTYTQGPVAHLTVSGPQGMVDHLVADDGILRFDAPVYGDGRLKIVLVAPSVRDFTLDGSGRLTIAGFDQDRMELNIRGSADVVAAGKARDVELNIAGSGSGDLGGLATEAAEVRIAGSGDATIAPRRRAEVKIAGSGDVTLVTEPHSVDSNVVGSGQVIHRAPPPPAAPAAPAKPV